MASLHDRWIRSTGIDWPCYTQMLKGALAPTIALACGQSDAWIQAFGSLGYLVPVAAIICYPFQPRAQFLRSLYLNSLTVCFSAAWLLLAMFCVIKARTTTAPYDSSASAVAALWLVVMTFVITAVRVKYAAMIWPCSAALVFSNYGTVYAAGFVTTEQQIAFLRKLLLVHLVGFCISTGVSFLFFPTNARKPFFDAWKQCMAAARSCLDANRALRQRCKNRDWAALPGEIANVRQTTTTLSQLLQKLAAVRGPATVELHFNGLTPAEIEVLFSRTRDVLEPLIGLQHLADTAQQSLLQVEEDGHVIHASTERLSGLLELMHSQLDLACAAASDGIEIAMRDLKLKNDSDNDQEHVEVGSDEQKAPGRDGFTTHVETCLTQLLASGRALATPCLDSKDDDGESSFDDTMIDSHTARSQIFAVMHNQFLTWTTTHRVLELVEFTSSLDLCSKRPITLRLQQLANGIWQCFANPFGNPINGVPPTADKASGHPPSPYKQRYRRRINTSPWSVRLIEWERRAKPYLHINTYLRFFASQPAAFALRVTAGVMSIAIVAFLKYSASFYVSNHLFWAQYLMSFAMQNTTGQGLRHLFYRALGTIVAVSMALVAFYIVNGNPAGAIVFFFVFMHVPIWLMLSPRLQGAGTVSAFALIVVLGNKLQLLKIGTANAQAMGLATPPMWLLALIRLAAIAGGLLLATIWTILPYPISEHDLVRHTAVTCLNSVARYHTSTYLMIRGRLHDSSAEIEYDKDEEEHDVREIVTADNTRRVSSTQHRRTADLDSQLANMNRQLNLVKWNLPFGHDRSTRTQYDTIHANLADLVRSIDLERLAAVVFADSVSTASNLASSQWLRRFRSVYAGSEETSHQVTMLIMVLANALNTSTPLPPFLRVPDPLALTRHLDRVDKDVMSMRHAGEPGMGTFATIQVEVQSVHACLTAVLAAVKELVGEFDVNVLV